MSLFRLIVALLMLFVPALAVAGPLQLGDLRIVRDPAHNTRVELYISGAVPYRAFTLNNPPRLVVDLPKMGWSAPMNKGDANFFIRSYRQSVFHEDTLRVVFLLNKPVTVASHERQHASDSAVWRYSFTLKPVTSASFAKNAGKNVFTGGGANGGATAGTGDDGAAAAATVKTVTKTTTVKNTVVPVPQPTAAVPVPSSPPAAVLTVEAGKKPLVVIDPGHGGVDPGALATNGTLEKTITLATGKELKHLLEATGRYRVQMTRDTDVYIKLPDRVRIARSAGADLFISLHADTISRNDVQGASVYTLSNKASDTETAKLAQRENAVDSLVNVDVGKVDADVADILVDLVTRDTMNQSRVLAETVVGTFGQSGVYLMPREPHRSAGFAVLKAPDIPSILIEMGYLSNKKEADQLSDPSYRARLAAAVAKVIDRYFSDTSKSAMY